MKKQLFLYLLIVSVLMNLFTYSYFSKQVKFEKEQAEKVKTVFNDSLAVMHSKLFEANHFSLEQNDMSQDYFENYNITLLTEKVYNSLLDYNGDKEGNPYTGYERIGDKKFIINKIKILNHRWIIADFSNGDLWGEAIIQYFIEADETVTFEILKSFLHPKQ